jgi:amino acid adenylation domain-containing protein
MSDITEMNAGRAATAAEAKPGVAYAGPPMAPAGLIHRLFEAQAARTPDAAALLHASETITYRELDARANRLARHLHALGVGPEVPVGVFCSRTPEMIVGLLAILKAGGAYVPLDPAYPAERVGFMLAETGVRAVVTESRVAGRLPSTSARLVRVDADADVIARQSDEPLHVHVHPENLAYVIYTSGSTGKPKGVQIEHRSTVARLRWLRDSISDAERSAVLGSTSICFDVSIAEIFGTLCWGGKLVLVENALALAALPAGHEVRTACMVPAAATELLRVGAIPASVRTLGLGGEPVSNELARGLYALGSVQRVLNLYGPTEDTTYSTCKQAERDPSSAMTVGRTLPGTRAHVLDDAGGACLHGSEGEVCLSGAGLARGYLGRPGATAEKFVPNAFGAPGSRMYRTGDLGRFRADGELECLGRVDQQVKVRGFRVEPGEVEAVLCAHPGVAAAAVVVREDRGDRLLVAYVVAPGAAPSRADLRARVAGRLPEYMVPTHFVAVHTLPLTPNGKVDRRALLGAAFAPAPADAGLAGGQHAHPHREELTPVQERLAEIFADVLGVDEVGVDDDFFDLGGHSLRAMRVNAWVHDSFGVELTARSLFDARTVRALAVEVERLAAPGEDDILAQLAMLEEMSEDEVRRLLAEVGG